MPNIRTAIAATALLAGILLTGCGSNSTNPPEQPAGPDVAACKAAMKQQLDEGMKNPNAPSGTRPPECNGVDDATLQRLVGEVVSEKLGEVFATATPS